VPLGYLRPLRPAFDFARVVVGHPEYHVKPGLPVLELLQVVVAYLPSVSAGVEVPRIRRLEPNGPDPLQRPPAVFVVHDPDYPVLCPLQESPSRGRAGHLVVVLPEIRAPVEDEVLRGVERLRNLVRLGDRAYQETPFYSTNPFKAFIIGASQASTRAVWCSLLRSRVLRNFCLYITMLSFQSRGFTSR